MADAAAVAAVRAFIGSNVPPSDDDISDSIDAGATANAVALAYLNGRLADMVANPLKQSWGDDYSEDRTANLKALQQQIERVAALVAGETVETDDGPITTMRLVRRGARR